MATDDDDVARVLNQDEIDRLLGFGFGDGDDEQRAYNLNRAKTLARDAGAAVVTNPTLSTLAKLVSTNPTVRESVPEPAIAAAREELAAAIADFMNNPEE